MEEARLAAIERGLALLDQRLPMAPTMDGRLPLHQDCRELLAEVRRLRETLMGANGKTPAPALAGGC